MSYAELWSPLQNIAQQLGIIAGAQTQGAVIIQQFTTAQKAALVNPPTSLLIYDTTIPALQLNTGTPASPIWTSV